MSTPEETAEAFARRLLRDYDCDELVLCEEHLAPLFRARDREVAAKALEEAAAEIRMNPLNNARRFSDWLRARAARLREGEEAE